MKLLDANVIGIPTQFMQVSDDELELIKAALDFWHNSYQSDQQGVILELPPEPDVAPRMVLAEEMCHELGIPGYEFT